jgi:hypothetical protein
MNWSETDYIEPNKNDIIYKLMPILYFVIWMNEWILKENQIKTNELSAENNTFNGNI